MVFPRHGDNDEQTATWWQVTVAFFLENPMDYLFRFRMLIWDNFVVGWCECCWRDSCFSLFKDWFILWHKPYRCTYTDDMINAHRFATTYDKICYHTLQTQGNPSNCWWNVPWPRHHCFRISKGFGIHQNPKIFNQVNHEQEIQRGPPWVSFIRDVILPLIFGNNKGKNKIRSSVDSTSITRSGSMNQRENGGTVYPLSRAPSGGWTAGVPSQG